MCDQSAARSGSDNTHTWTRPERPTTDPGLLIFADNAVGSQGGVDNILPR